MCNIRGSCVADGRECDPAATCNLKHRVSDGGPIGCNKQHNIDNSACDITRSMLPVCCCKQPFGVWVLLHRCCRY